MQVMSNVCAFRTDAGLALVDTGTPYTAEHVHASLRRWTDAPLHTAVFSHGHIDHVFGVAPFDEEATSEGRRPPTVYGHEAMVARFDRYVMTAGWNAAINARQFQIEGLVWPTEYRHPDVTYRERIEVDLGGEIFELHHARGETDDHTWTWIPSRRVLCTGDLFIWATPNAGNPQKVQRYAWEWAEALRTMATLDAEVLLPGHGFPVVGADRVRQALHDTATLLESLHDQTVALMNEGATLDEVIHTVTAPPALVERPYLRPVYDEPEFIVRNIWRLYGGWYDGNPAHLKPAPDAQVAEEVARLSGGARTLAERATEIADNGDLRLACHLVEWAVQAAPHDHLVRATRADVYARRRDEATSTMAKGVYGWAAKESSPDAPVG
ncbi:MAG: MBL fold metallo-hydrolase [Actinobacteria bacterium]|nr:MBL fold metallo-hydrolase [Actinomycetota bacterium]